LWDSRYLDDTIPLINYCGRSHSLMETSKGFPTDRQFVVPLAADPLPETDDHYVSFEGNYLLQGDRRSSAGRNGWIGNLVLDNPQVARHLQAEHGIGSNDAPHRLTTAFIADIPVGRERWIGRGMNVCWTNCRRLVAVQFSHACNPDNRWQSIQCGAPRDGNQRRR